MLRNFTTDRVPIRAMFAKPNVGKPGGEHHRLNLVTREPMFKPRSESIKGIGSHDVEARMLVLRQGQMRNESGSTRQGPVHARGYRVGNQSLCPKGKRAYPFADNIAGLPDRTKPRGPVVESIVKINKERGTGLQFGNALVKPVLSVGNVMQDAQRIAEVAGVIGQGNVIDPGLMKFTVGAIRKFRSGNVQRLFARVDQVQSADAASDELGPTARTATKIETNGVKRQAVPRKDVEVLVESPSQFVLGEFALIETRPLAAEIGHNVLINVHRKTILA